MRRRACIGVAFIAWLAIGCAGALAEEPLAPAAGEVVLSVSGAIARTNAPGRADFDRDMLMALGARKLGTTTPWTEGVQEFEGPLLADVMAAVGARGARVTAVALNDYKAVLAMADFRHLGVLLALKHNGKPMPVRAKGPIWIIYPAGPGDAPQDLETRGKMVWQLRELRVE